MVTVLVNLLDNAYKYTPDDKRITVRVSRESGQGDQVVFAVEDNGIGIPSREQKRIFRRFYRVDRRLARETTGSGLGLSIVDAIVRAHGGTVRVDSRPEQGSTFTVSVPCATGGGRRVTAAARMLIVEDEPALMRGLTDTFRARGFEVSSARDGASGLDAALARSARCHPARHHAAEDERLRGLPRDPRSRDRRADPDAHGEGTGGGRHPRPEPRCRRLHHQAVQDWRADRAGQRAAAPPRRGAAGAPLRRRARSTCRRGRSGAADASCR